MIDNEKLIPKKNPKGIGVVTTVFYGKVNRKVLKVGNILKGTLADDKKRFERKKAEDKKDQIIKGKLNKFIKENTLLGQALITEPKKTVHSFLNEVSKNNNINLNIISMDLYTI